MIWLGRPSRAFGNFDFQGLTLRADATIHYVASGAPQTEMIQNQAQKDNLHDFNGSVVWRAFKDYLLFMPTALRAQHL